MTGFLPTIPDLHADRTEPVVERYHKEIKALVGDPYFEAAYLQGYHTDTRHADDGGRRREAAVSPRLIESKYLPWVRGVFTAEGTLSGAALDDFTENCEEITDRFRDYIRKFKRELHKDGYGAARVYLALKYPDAV